MIGLRGSLSWPPEFGTSLTSGGEILATDQLPKIPSIPAIHFRVVSKVESDIISLKKELSSQLDPKIVNLLQPVLSTSPIVLDDKTAPMVVL